MWSISCSLFTRSHRVFNIEHKATPQSNSFNLHSTLHQLVGPSLGPQGLINSLNKRPILSLSLHKCPSKPQTCTAVTNLCGTIKSLRCWFKPARSWQLRSSRHNGGNMRPIYNVITINNPKGKRGTFIQDDPPQNHLERKFCLLSGF